jgi:hypothetical protein
MSTAYNLAISWAQLRPITLAVQLKNHLFWAALIEARAWSSGSQTDAHQYSLKESWIRFKAGISKNF